ncbi:MAG TPA: DUF742 domain-containing protein [Streptosporangiaceae bacterium]|nr:DUF742 domain-containing protein [Streptosporangiaceae bacterium]
MSPRPVDRESPDRLYTVTGGRTLGDEEDPFDLVSLIVSAQDPVPGMQSEHVAILRTCQHPTAVVEISSDLGLPVSVVKVLLRDLLDIGSITVRHRAEATARTPLPDRDMLKQVLVGLQKL